jgi:hypothetical protein
MVTPSPRRNVTPPPPVVTRRRGLAEVDGRVTVGDLVEPPGERLGAGIRGGAFQPAKMGHYNRCLQFGRFPRRHPCFTRFVCSMTFPVRVNTLLTRSLPRCQDCHRPGSLRRPVPL